MKRIILIVLDSVGIGALPDAADYGDLGSNTLQSASTSPYFNGLPNLRKLGLFNIDGVTIDTPEPSPIGCYGRLAEQSKGKDTTIGHWEIAGVISKTPLPTYPNGFPNEILDLFRDKTGHGVLCNKPYSGTNVIADFGDEHLKTGDLIVYTSADSVFQIAAHEDVIPIETLYQYCEIARKILVGKHGVGRVIARPFTGESGNYSRTSRRHDYSLQPPAETMLDVLENAGCDVLSVGKIIDIFAEKGITKYIRSNGNMDGITKTLAYMNEDWNGLCFTNLVDYDMLYGHRNDIDGYAKALNEFDHCVPELMNSLREEDILMITADHGCDPGTPSTDHSREYIPLLMYGKTLTAGINIGTRETFSDIAETILDIFGLCRNKKQSLLPFIMK